MPVGLHRQRKLHNERVRDSIMVHDGVFVVLLLRIDPDAERIGGTHGIGEGERQRLVILARIREAD